VVVSCGVVGVFGVGGELGVGELGVGVFGLEVFSRWKACVKYADFTLRYLTVTFEYCDLFWVGGDCAAFEEHEGVSVTASLLKVDESK